ncbi:hypothetical protein DM02DRAFT_182429 [Periconia macrospinosa]|uniref:Uncharacterized protein n=1 Tax=Periconia macrospinosa TaxID=97972 RepID=A0A2V1D9G6_9PLEO|nr:hypothetical protein DM02DRAFT_182429 [Periconia macrospinosa]
MSDKSLSTGDEDIPRSAPINIPGRGRGRGAAGRNAGLFREECSGLPEKGHMFPPEFEEKFKKKFKEDRYGNFKERQPAAGRPSGARRSLHIQQKVEEAMIEFMGQKYLLLSSATLRNLSPLWTGLQPIPNPKIFERILVNKDVQEVHADHARAALEKIGKHCKHFVVLSPIRTSEFGEVFKRESANLGTTVNDWSWIFKSLPNLVSITFKHPDNEPGDLLKDTFKTFQSAVVGAQYPTSLQVQVSAPLHLLNPR